MPNADLSIDVMQSHEVAQLVEWAANESWNPGLSDVAAAWAVDPDAFIAVRKDHELVGGGTIVSYDGAFGFMGLFIVRPDLRGRGIGTSLWYHRRDRLVRRLAPGASVGMDGVFDMVPFYERGGFRLAYRDLRFEGVASGNRSMRAIDLAQLPMDVIDAFDRRFVPAPRSRFLSAWLSQSGGIGAAMVDRSGAMQGYGFLRPCRVGYKIGPLFADDPAVAEEILDHLLGAVPGQQVQVDVPEPNTVALDLVAQRGLVESFGCARMYLGADPCLPTGGIFGVTSFEFG